MASSDSHRTERQCRPAARQYSSCTWGGVKRCEHSAGGARSATAQERLPKRKNLRSMSVNGPERLPSNRLDVLVTQISLPRLYALRLAFLILGGGLILVKWPTLISHSSTWPLW